MNEKRNWRSSSRPGRLYSLTDDGRVQCNLSPRNCNMREGQHGFCGVRMNKGGVLHTLNYGKSVQVTEETIETEAVYHYYPGSRILSLGNIGCMMNCDYCHNWKTSQARFVEDQHVHEYTPEQIVTMAKERNIPVLSWTYNDPVVWHEFVAETSQLAHRNGLTNLYKSAFFISIEGAAELCEVIDIFSISIKTMNEKLYRKISKGWLQPVLEATKFVYNQGKHLEISNLMVTDANDTEEDARELAEWVLTELSDSVPIHFVRFHPDYKYTHVSRTPIERLVRAREIALEMGIKNCYLGNVYGHKGTNTYCNDCGNLLVERYGLKTAINGLSNDGSCMKCGHATNIVQMAKPMLQRPHYRYDSRKFSNLQEFKYEWHGDINACHIEITNNSGEKTNVFYTTIDKTGRRSDPYSTHIGGNDSYRFIISKSSIDEVGLCLKYPDHVRLKLYEVYDRAHFPTNDIFTELKNNVKIIHHR